MNSQYSQRYRSCEPFDLQSHEGRVLDYFSRYLVEASKESDNARIINSGAIRRLDKLITDKHLCTQSCLSNYLSGIPTKKDFLKEKPLIFPFGCNLSQVEAVEKAFSSNLSIIQGPPGTGKTQTILNIIANLLIRDMSVAVVSNNNSATKNVQEKLSSNKYQLGWLVAELGSAGQHERFFKSIPKIALNNEWEQFEPDFDHIRNLNENVRSIFQKRIEIQNLKSELAQLEAEIQVFLEEEEKKGTSLWLWAWYSANLKKLDSSSRSKLQEKCLKLMLPQSNFARWFRKLILRFQGIRHIDQIEPNIDAILSANTYADAVERREILTLSIEGTEEWIDAHKQEELELTQKSLEALYASIWTKYKDVPNRTFNAEDYRYDSIFWNRFPIVTSTTFALHRSKPKGNFDFVIIDEASQAGLPTAASSLSCANSAVVVGDLKQLPVIIPENALHPSSDIPAAFDATKHSILSSMVEVMGDKAPQTLLREHYRCHPDIIGFCNKQFYDGKLITMTNRGTAPAFTWIETSENVVKHVKGSVLNERQILITRDWLDLHRNDVANQDVGIISPYRPHAESLKNIPNVVSDTVHSFQGRECDTIIFNAVKDEITTFNNDPNLINVAVSRAKSHFVLVSSSYDENADSNLACLVRYIKHLKPEYRRIYKSKYRSIFDVLYKKNNSAFIPRRKSGESPAEALFRNLLMTLQKDERFGHWKFTQEYPLRLVPISLDSFTNQERRYMFNGARLDFILYDAFDRQPIAVVEVDGASYHKDGTRQSERDVLKNTILEKVGVPLFRFRTDSVEGQELEQISTFLSKIYADRNANKSKAVTD